MTESVQADFLTFEELLTSEPEAPIEGVKEVSCTEFAGLYLKAIAGLDEQKDQVKIRSCRLLNQLCWLHFKPTDRAEPYGPIFVHGGKRSAIPSDFRGKQNDALASLAPLIKNPALRARLADVCWLNDRRLVDCGRLAVRSYIECVERLLKGEVSLRHGDDKAWDIEALDMLRRALVIANRMGRDKEEAQLAQKTLEIVRRECKNSGDSGDYFRACKVALDFRTADPRDIGDTLEAEASKVLTGGDFQFAADICQEAERAYHLARDVTAENRCAVSTAECYIAGADVSKVSAMNEAHWLQQAIAKLRRVLGTQERRRELQSRLVSVQPRIRDEMSVYTTEHDLTDLANQATAQVTRRSFVQALAEFAQLTQSPDPEALREAAKRSARETPLLAMMSATIHDNEGKVVARVPGLDIDGSIDDEALQFLIMKNEAQRRGFVVAGLIEPARVAIEEAHPLAERDFLPLLGMSFFVPPEREHIFARAFVRFFGGDYMSAIHLLYPQLENSMRFLLKQNGVDVTSIKSDMTQQDLTISVMLDNFRADLEKIFGPAIVTEIKNLFDHTGGPTVRHSVAHGLMAQGAFWSDEVIYACWFIYSLCVLPLLPNLEEIEQYNAKL